MLGNKQGSEKWHPRQQLGSISSTTEWLPPSGYRAREVTFHESSSRGVLPGALCGIGVTTLHTSGQAVDGSSVERPKESALLKSRLSENCVKFCDAAIFVTMETPVKTSLITVVKTSCATRCENSRENFREHL